MHDESDGDEVQAYDIAPKPYLPPDHPSRRPIKQERRVEFGEDSRSTEKYVSGGTGSFDSPFQLKETPPHARPIPGSSVSQNPTPPVKRNIEADLQVGDEERDVGRGVPAKRSRGRPRKQQEARGMNTTVKRGRDRATKGTVATVATPSADGRAGMRTEKTNIAGNGKGPVTRAMGIRCAGPSNDESE